MSPGGMPVVATSPLHYGDTFRAAVDFVIDRLEGGGQFVDRPTDLGGPTKWGISQRQYPNLDIAKLTREGAVGIYYTDYWVPCYGDNMPPPLALLVFAAWVNMPPREVARCLQKAVGGVVVDGVLGSKTLGAVRKYTPQSELRARFSRECIGYYQRLVDRAPFHKPNLQGWIGRVLRVADESHDSWGPKFA